MRFEHAPFFCAANFARLALGSTNAGTPLADRVCIDLLPGRLLLALRRLDCGCAALIGGNNQMADPKIPLENRMAWPENGRFCTEDCVEHTKKTTMKRLAGVWRNPMFLA
jgi:hypothetical protein